MRAALPFLSVLFIFAPTHNVSAEESAPSPIPGTGTSLTKEQVEALVLQLANKDPAVREEADRKLCEADHRILQWFVELKPKLDAEASGRLEGIFAFHLVAKRMDEVLSKIDAPDWPWVQMSVDELLALLLHEGRLWKRLQAAAGRKDAPAVITAIAAWGERDNAWKALKERDAQEKALEGMIATAKSEDEKAKLEAELEKFKGETAKKFIEPLLATCKTAFEAAKANRKTPEMPAKEAPKDPPAKP